MLQGESVTGPMRCEQLYNNRLCNSVLANLNYFIINFACTWSDNKVRELVAVKVRHTTLLNITVVAFKVLPFGSYAPMPASNPPFETDLDAVLSNGLQSCRRANPDVINVMRMPSFQYFLYIREQKTVIGG
jgi:hypothetical protein